jgi:hypothetical protein
LFTQAAKNKNIVNRLASSLREVFMLNRKNLVVSFVLVLLVAMLAGCAAGGATMPEGEVEVSMDAAMEAQNKAMAGLMAGKVALTDSELSSLATELIKQNLGDMGLVTGITTMFSDGQIAVQVDTVAGPIQLVGNIMVDGNVVSVELEQAAAMGMAATGPMLGVVEGAINRALNSPELGVALDIQASDGELMVGLGQ